VADVDRLRGVRILLRGLRLELGLDREALRARGERTERIAARCGGRVHGDIGVGDLLTRDREDAEPKAVLPRGIDLASGRCDEARMLGLAAIQELVEALALCRRE